MAGDMLDVFGGQPLDVSTPVRDQLDNVVLAKLVQDLPHGSPAGLEPLSDIVLYQPLTRPHLTAYDLPGQDLVQASPDGPVLLL